MDHSSTESPWQTKISEFLVKEELNIFGFAPLQRPLSMDIYHQWLSEGYGAQMDYLKRHAPQKANPQLLMASARTAISLAVPYDHPSQPKVDFPLKALKVARYARGADYHLWISQWLQKMCEQWQLDFPGAQFTAFVDSSPVLERDLAHRSGLGWHGKNSCLINKNIGSLFFICEVYTSLRMPESDEAPPLPTDHCGKCRRCIEACPTDAFNDNRTLDANKCISYWTIESREVPPTSIRENMQSWFFGCDICQNVCPWNKDNLLTESQASLTTKINELRWILTSSNKALQRAFAGTPLTRAGGRGLKRNALIVIGNERIIELKDNVKEFLAIDYFRSLAQWTLKKLATNSNLTTDGPPESG